MINDAGLAWILTVPFLDAILKPSALDIPRDPGAGRKDDLPIYIAPAFPFFNHLLDFETFSNEMPDFSAEAAIFGRLPYLRSYSAVEDRTETIIAELSEIGCSSLTVITSPQA